MSIQLKRDNFGKDENSFTDAAKISHSWLEVGIEPVITMTSGEL